jgi:hypothetical protein
MTLSCPGIALDATVRARILAYAYRGVDAATMGIGPVPAQGRPGLERRPTARSRVRRDRDVEDRSLLASTTCWRTSRRTPGGCLRPQLGRWPSRREALRALAGPRWRRRRELLAGGGGLQLQGDRREARGDLHERQPARVRGAGRAEGAQARRLTWCGGDGHPPAPARNDGSRDRGSTRGAARSRRRGFQHERVETSIG